MFSSFLKFMPYLFSFSKSMVDDAKHKQKIKSFDKTREKIDTIEHLITKLEKKISDCRNEIEDLRRHIIISRIFNFVLAVVIIFLVIFMR